LTKLNLLKINKTKFLSTTEKNRMQATATQGSSSHFTKLIEAAAMVSSGPGNFLTDEGSVTLYVSQESAGRTIFLADLPRNTSYIDLSEYFEKIIGPCVIQIKR
jgi:hypothetical protein